METTRDAPQDIAVLLLTPEGEDHTLGAVTLCTLLRRRGYAVDLHLNASRRALLTRVRQGHYDVVMASCSRPQALDSLGRLFTDIRTRIEQPPALAVGGVVLDHTSNVQEQTGADLATRDIHQVLKLAVSCRKGRISVVA
jgi:methanogenic corrinoid protein MtbC1